jgi:excisionase family DNA binding protein
MSLEHSPARAGKARPGRIGRWPLLMRVSEAAFELRLSTRRIYQLIAAGELDNVKIGKARRVTSASVRKLAGDLNPEADDPPSSAPAPPPPRRRQPKASGTPAPTTEISQDAAPPRRRPRRAKANDVPATQGQA